MTAPVIEEPRAGEDPGAARRRRRAERYAEAAAAGWKVWLVKIAALAIIDAAAVYAAMVLIAAGSWIVAAVVLLLAVAVTVVYLTPGLLPAKYLTPGLIFLLIFQVFVVGYTVYIAFTNYGTGHNSTKEDAVAALLVQSESPVEGGPVYDATVLERDGVYFLLVTDPETGDAEIGTTGEALAPVDAEFDGDKAVAVDGYTTLDFGTVVKNQTLVSAVAVPVSDDPADGYLRMKDVSSAQTYLSDLAWDASADTMTDVRTGTVYRDIGTGAFTSADGEELLPGWSANVGFANFTRAFTEPSIREPFLAVAAWTLVFAVLSVATTFALGLFLAIVFNDPRMRSRKYYRVIMILPYAFPAFLSALVWAGMFNQDFGFVNQVLLGGAEVPWLQNEWLAKAAILIVNLWLGFPYMFLVCTGAIQSIPEDITEAARMDGANVWQIFRRIKFPLLLVSVAPLLISSFAFNFNNFNLIYMLTRGGPRFADASINVGATDILISMVYKVAFVGQLRDYGLASAFSIIIFLIVGVISYLGFRQTKVLEELN